MTRSLPLAAALALAAAGSGCTKGESSAAGARLRQPEAIAVFQGVTLASPKVRPYLAVANASRNDVAIVDAVTNDPVKAPVVLRTLVVPVPDRPSLLAAASLGDETVEQPHRADLLVAVSAGDSVLQVIETWDSKNLVHSDPAEAGALAVDLGHDVLALAPLPPDPADPGVARIAAALSDGLVAVVAYRRGDGDAIVHGSTAIRTTPLPFQPVAIAAMPDDPAVPGLQTAIYLASREAVDPGAVPPIFGVAELPGADVEAQPRVLGARAPTRLVAAARLQERFDHSADSGTGAFQAERVPRVYAVLDESACGPDKPIDCGVVTLDAGPAVPSGSMAIPDDYAGLMPHRAPMRVPGRPLAIVAAGPPAVPLGTVDGDPVDYPAGFMRLFMGSVGRATTAVAAVPSDDGKVYFLDLGRFETATAAPIVQARSTGPTAPEFEPPPQEDPAQEPPATDEWLRLWIQDENGAFVAPNDAAARRNALTTTPGFTPNETVWSLIWEGVLSADLAERTGEVMTDVATGQLALALQVGDRPSGGPATFTQVARLWHPALGVKVNDIVVIPVNRMGAGLSCEGTRRLLPPGSTQVLPNEFEVRIGALLPPSDQHPGGAVTLVPAAQPPPPAPPDERIPAWQACYDVLSAGATGTNVVTGVRATIRASGLVLRGAAFGYAGRPPMGDPGVPRPHELRYPGGAAEAQLTAECPLADWDGSWPTTHPLACTDACRTSCEQLVIARKVRRLHNVSVTCETNSAQRDTCNVLWPGNAFPTVNDPVALKFQVAVQKQLPAPGDLGPYAPFRDMELEFGTTSGVGESAASQSGTAPQHATGAVPFDRTPWTTAAEGYRFYVSYPADFVLDATPSLSGNPVPSAVIR
ncbi:MAG TPA: hypothetical protein VFL83_04930 [Anaeromyxobacter sp.]|nr:hypothetical protein [Anaeromyxobacter sp.]